jgi:hypothetical protein
LLDLSDLKRCHLQSKNLEKLIFVSKNWPKDSKGSCKEAFSLVEFIEKEKDFEDKLEEFGEEHERK